MHLFSRRREFIDMTQGGTIARVLRFALPLVFGNLFQQFYAFVDAAIVGQFVGVNAFAAIGSMSWIIWWIGTIPRDCANAFCIAASIRIGSKNEEEFQQLAALAVCFAGAVALAVTAALLLLLDPLLHALAVAPVIYADARIYFLIFVCALPIGLAFHTICALLRAAGNGSITFTAMSISTAVNIVLDILFVAVLPWGVAGAAAATLLAQLVSLCIALYAARHSGLFRMERVHFARCGRLLSEILALWLPLVLNSFIITFGGAIVQNRVNAVGTYFTAGYEVGTKLYAFFEGIILALQMGTSVFIGQNLGAGKPLRIRSGMRRILLLSFGVAVATVAIIWLFGDTMVGWFLSEKDAALFLAAKTVGRRYARVLVLGMLVMTPMYQYRIGIQTLGHPNYTIAAGVVQLIARVLTVLFLPLLIGEEALYFTEIFAWGASLPAVAIPFEIHLNRLCKRAKAENHKEVTHAL